MTVKQILESLERVAEIQYEIRDRNLVVKPKARDDKAKRL